MTVDHGMFQCIVIAPMARLLDCKTTSVVLPAHDGKLGIWQNHMPMFCELGLGIMEVRRVTGDIDKPFSDVFVLIDGGVVLVKSNVVTIIAYDAIYLQDMTVDKIEPFLEKTEKKLRADMVTPQQREHNIRKIFLLTELAERSVPPRIPAPIKEEEVLIPQ